MARKLIDVKKIQNITPQERIQKAKLEQQKCYTEYNEKKRQEEIEGNFKYEKSVFCYRSQTCSYSTAVNYIKSYYPEIKASKKLLMEILQKSDIVKFAGNGSIGFVSGTSLSGVGRTSYEMITMDSVDEFAVDLIYNYKELEK